MTPLTLGIETAGGVLSYHRPKHHHSLQKSKVFTTAQDNQDMVRVMFQGEREMSDNKSLGRLRCMTSARTARTTRSSDLARCQRNHARQGQDLGTGKAQQMQL